MNWTKSESKENISNTRRYFRKEKQENQAKHNVTRCRSTKHVKIQRSAPRDEVDIFSLVDYLTDF